MSADKKLTLPEITSHKIVPVVVVNDANQADGLADALVQGGLPVAEVTFRTAAAPEAIKTMASRGDVIVGAGTVLTADQVDQAADNGARFIVSPGFNPAVVERALDKDLIVLPGAITPTEIMSIISMGLTTVKFFPAGTNGGAKAIKALSAPFVGINFMPTGGVSAANVGEYLSLDCIPAVGGSWMVPAAAVDAGEFDQIIGLVKEAVHTVSQY